MSPHSVFIARSARRGRRLLATAFLTRSQTKDVSARSLVQDSGAPAWLSTAVRDPGQNRESLSLLIRDSARPDGGDNWIGQFAAVPGIVAGQRS
jgi:hypothetical protein